jgi:hypothetical protein
MFDRAIAESRTTLRALHQEADALSVKGMCQDDFEFYAQRLTELEQHLAYLEHLVAVEAKAEAMEQLAFAVADAMNEDETLVREYEGDDVPDDDRDLPIPASCAYCCHSLPGYADGTTRWCSEECWEMSTAPGYYNAATDGAVRRELLLQQAEADAIASGDRDAFLPYLPY